MLFRKWRERDDYIAQALAYLVQEIQRMSASLDRLKADVAAQTTVDQSAVTLIQGIVAQLKAAASGTADVDLDALSTQLEAAAAPLAAAVSTNTPAASGSTGSAASAPPAASGVGTGSPTS